MDFIKSFTRPINEAVQMEASWFYELSNDQQPPVIKLKARHRMPFLYSNLNFERGIQPDENDAVKIRLLPRKRRQRMMRLEDQRQQTLSKVKKKPDLLYSLFRHRTEDYNSQLLGAPRRQTRKSLKAGLRTPAAASETKHVSDDKTDFDSKIIEDETQRNIVTASHEGGSSLEDKADFTKTMLNTMFNHQRRPENDNSKAKKKKKKKKGKDGGAVLKPKTKVVFSFLYVDPEDGSIAMQSDTNEINGCRRCHLCFFRTKTDEDLLMHCVATHGEHLDFDACKCENSSLHVVAKRTPRKDQEYPCHLKDFTFIRYPKLRDAEIPVIGFLERSAANIISMDKATRVKKMRLLNEVEADEEIIEKYEPNPDKEVRRYFHSRTNEPMQNGEWNIDSDEESDHDWYEKMAEDLIDDFEDVTEPEKRFIKMWNRFMGSHTVVPDLAISKRCLEFIRSHIVVLEKYKLRRELNLHLTGFWDYRLVSQSHLHYCMREYDGLVQKIVAKRQKRKFEEHQNGNGKTTGLDDDGDEDGERDQKMARND